MENEIWKELLSFRNAKNALFVAKLIPTIDPKTILGTKIPLLRKPKIINPFLIWLLTAFLKKTSYTAF